jgi:hypothetical protein
MKCVVSVSTVSAGFHSHKYSNTEAAWCKLLVIALTIKFWLVHAWSQNQVEACTWGNSYHVIHSLTFISERCVMHASGFPFSDTLAHIPSECCVMQTSGLCTHHFLWMVHVTLSAWHETRHGQFPSSEYTRSHSCLETHCNCCVMQGPEQWAHQTGSSIFMCQLREYCSSVLLRKQYSDTSHSSRCSILQQGGLQHTTKPQFSTRCHISWSLWISAQHCNQ